MSILLKLDNTKFGVFNLFLFKSYRRKTFGGSARPTPALDAGWVKSFIIERANVISITILEIKLSSKLSFPLLNPKQAGGGEIRPQAGSSLCCAETVSSKKLKLYDFYHILIGLNSEYKPVTWDIHCCHGNAIVEGCLLKFWLKSVENCTFLLKSFSNFNFDSRFVISISNPPPPSYQISSKWDKKQKS